MAHIFDIWKNKVKNLWYTCVNKDDQHRMLDFYIVD